MDPDSIVLGCLENTADLLYVIGLWPWDSMFCEAKIATMTAVIL